MPPAMRLSPLLSLPVLFPTLQVQACRSTPLLTYLDALRPQSFPTLALSNFATSPRSFASTSQQQQQQQQQQHQQAMTGQEKPQRRVSYKVAASFSAKGRKFDSRKDVYIYDPSPKPEPEAAEEEKEIYTGRPAAGQDAFFISSFPPSADKKRASDMVFGVADGVGGWADSGIDSADFSHGLCRAMAFVASGVEKKIGPRELLDRGYRRVVEKGDVAGGGSTACVAVGGGEGVVRVANLGDSGFLQLRPSAVHYSSNPQTHAFNTPFQLSIVPPKVLQMSKMFGGGPLSDLPSEADVTAHEVSHGDVLVFATDGVWDNLPAEEVLGLVSRQMMNRHAWVDREGRSEVGKGVRRALEEGERALEAEVAIAIVSQAKAASNNSKRDGPFAREVQKHYPAENWHGGKVDDICVVVAIVVEDGGTMGNIGKPKL